MSRAISLVFSLAIAVVVAGGLSMPADARVNSGPSATVAERSLVATSNTRTSQQPANEPRADEVRSAKATQRPTSSAGGPGTSRTDAPSRADNRPTGVKARAEQVTPTHVGKARPQQGPPAGRGTPAGGPSEVAPSPVSPDRPVGAPGSAPVESPSMATPTTPAASPPAHDNAEAGSVTAPGASGPAGPAVSSPAVPTISSPVGPAVRIPVLGAWFADRIHGLMASPPALPRPQFGPIHPTDRPTAFGLLFALLGVWYILQRVAWNRLGHVPLTSPPGSGWDVAHG